MWFEKSLLFILLVGCASVWSRHHSGYESNDFNSEDSNDDSDNQIERQSHHSYHRSRRPDKRYLVNSHQRNENYMRIGDNDYPDTNDLLPRVYEIVQDISKNLREQSRFPPPPPYCTPIPSPPQIIYIPTPIQTSPSCSCPITNDLPSLNKRFPYVFEDTRQNWGLNSPNYDNNQYKPLSFDSVAKHRTEDDLSHQSNFPRKEYSSKRQNTDTANSAPNTCDIAALSCCQLSSEISKCMEERGCSENIGCSKADIKEILRKFENAYILS